jgi:hypothetical protein
MRRDGVNGAGGGLQAPNQPLQLPRPQLGFLRRVAPWCGRGS